MFLADREHEFLQIFIAFAVATILNTMILVLLQKRHEAQIFRIIALVYAGTISLRYLLAVYLWLNHANAGFSSTFWGDSGTYDTFGAAVAEAWSHESATTGWMSTLEGKANRGFIYFVACLYYVFGRNTLLVQLINGIVGAQSPDIFRKYSNGVVLTDKIGMAFPITAHRPAVAVQRTAQIGVARFVVHRAIHAIATAGTNRDTR